MEKKLAEIIKNSPHGTNVFGLAKHLVENRVKVFPCEAGDILWYLDYDLPKCFICPEKIVVQDIVLLKNTMLIRCSNNITLKPEDIGKIAFYTRKEAEIAFNN